MSEAAPETGAENAEAPATTENAQTTEAPKEAAKPAEAPKPDDWKNSIPEDIRSNPSIAKFMTAKDVNEFAGTVAKSYVNAAQMIGRDKVPLPKTDAEWDNWYKAAGRPDDPKGYEFKVPEDIPEGVYDADSAEVFRAKAHEAGLNPKQAAGLHDWFVSATAEAKKAEAEQTKAEVAKVEAALRAEWGAAFDTKAASAQAIVKELGGEEFAAFLDESKLGNDPRMVKAMAKVAEAMKGEGALVGKGGEEAQTPADLDREIGAFREEHKDALMDKWAPGHDAAVAKLSALYAKRYPDKKAVA